MKKILITGYRGQIGTLLIRKLLKEGYEIIGIDMQDVDEELLKKYKGRLELYKCDLLKEHHLKRIDLKDVCILIPLAAFITNTKNMIAVQKIIEYNILTLTNVLQMFKNLRQIIFPSSMMVYGKPLELITELHPTLPNTIYGATKLYIENLLKIYSALKKVDVSILRIAAAYGPGEYGGDRAYSSIPSFIRAAKNKEPIILFGEIYNKRDYIHVLDVVNAIHLTIKKPFNGVINIGSGKGITTSDLAKLVVKYAKTNIKKKDIKMSKLDYTLDITKAKDLIKYSPRINIKKGIKNELKREMQGMR